MKIDASIRQLNYQKPVGRIKQAMFKLMGAPYYSGNQPVILSSYYNGEKNAGELGAIKNYVPDTASLAARSWQAYTESELAQMIVNTYMLWVVGSGLKFKCEPERDILNSLGIKASDIIEVTESKFNLFMQSKRSVNTRKTNFHRFVYEAKKHAIVSGDVLIILDSGRKEERNKCVSARMIDGFYIKSNVVDREPSTGNYVQNGVEINEYGEPVAYHVQKDDMTFERVPAYTESGTLQAFLLVGLDYRVDFYRGVPLLSCVLESLKGLERYKEATISGAEERAKVPYSVEHNVSSTGENPFGEELKQALGRNVDPNTQRITNDMLEKTAANIRYSTKKTVVNMPIGSTLKAPFDGKQENSFADFYEKNFDILCATVGIPPEVALNKYTTSFSSSRGANKNWEHRIMFERTRLATDIYKPFYNFWLDLEIYSSRINIKNYVILRTKDDFLSIEAIQGGRFVGAKMPFIDPLKEVQAVRAKLGDQLTPLCDYDDATEELGGGDWASNIVKAAAQKKEAEGLGFSILEENIKESLS